ncbi:hypothetical protein MKMG_01596 [Methanogenium sp. MK-MG]|nr:hypothetical protein MKMG_01596 [Methanogenium sp. MK-MG]
MPDEKKKCVALIFFQKDENYSGTLFVCLTCVFSRHIAPVLPYIHTLVNIYLIRNPRHCGPVCGCWASPSGKGIIKRESLTPNHIPGAGKMVWCPFTLVLFAARPEARSRAIIQRMITMAKPMKGYHVLLCGCLGAFSVRCAKRMGCRGVHGLCSDSGSSAGWSSPGPAARRGLGAALGELIRR